MTIIYILTLAGALCALSVWVLNLLNARHVNARLYTIAPLVWAFNFLAFRIVELYCTTYHMLPMEGIEVWSGMVRLHAITTITIMGLMSWSGRNGRNGTN